VIDQPTVSHAASHRVRRAIAASRRYSLEVYKLGRDIFQRFPKEIIRILVAGSASLICQIVALAALYIYLRALENNTAVLGLASRESLLLFGVIAGLTLILLIAYSLLEYRVSTAILNLCRHYQSIGTGEALALASVLPHWFAGPAAQKVSTRHLRQILATDVYHRTRMTRVLLLALIPTARLVLCAGALLYINPQFSLVILFAVGIPVAGLYSVGRKVADTITIRESSSPAVFLQQRDLLERSWAQGAPLTTVDIDWETTLGLADSRYRQYFRRLRAKAFGTLLINTANTVGIMVLVSALGFWLINAQQGNWSLWLTYLVALRYFLSSVRSIAQSVISSTRFLRQTQRFTAFMAAATQAVHSGNPAAVPCPVSIAKAYQGDSKSVVDDDDDDDD
jgi:hypothetical protein